jgi:hypothetical protein
MHSVEAGFLDFLKRTQPPTHGPNPLSNVLSPKILQDVLRSKLKWGVIDMETHPTRNGVEAVFAVESGPLNLKPTLTKALEPLRKVVQDYVNAPVSVDVEFNDKSTESYSINRDPMEPDFPNGFKVKFEMGARALQASAQRVAAKYLAGV